MSGSVNNFLIDTNIVIYLSQGKLKASDFAKKGSSLYLSSVTYIEALGYSFPNQEEEKVVTKLCEVFERLFLTEEVEKQTISLRKKYKIKLPDAIIAATAIVYNLTLVTCNSDDFKHIFGLKILNPL
jgi:predicted nucleic acid-binding protein